MSAWEEDMEKEVAELKQCFNKMINNNIDFAIIIKKMFKTFEAEIIIYREVLQELLEEFEETHDDSINREFFTGLLEKLGGENAKLALHTVKNCDNCYFIPHNKECPTCDGESYNNWKPLEQKYETCEVCVECDQYHDCKMKQPSEQYNETPEVPPFIKKVEPEKKFSIDETLNAIFEMLSLNIDERLKMIEDGIGILLAERRKPEEKDFNPNIFVDDKKKPFKISPPPNDYSHAECSRQKAIFSLKSLKGCSGRIKGIWESRKCNDCSHNPNYIGVEEKDLNDLVSYMEFDEAKHDYDEPQGYKYRLKYLPEEKKSCNQCDFYGECDHQGAYQKDGVWCYE